MPIFGNDGIFHKFLCNWTYQLSRGSDGRKVGIEGFLIWEWWTEDFIVDNSSVVGGGVRQRVTTAAAAAQLACHGVDAVVVDDNGESHMPTVESAIISNLIINENRGYIQG
jgi:hypothetical protein